MDPRNAYWTDAAARFHHWRLSGLDAALAWRSFDDLVRERLLRYCARALERRRSDVEDAVQDILIRLMEYAHSTPSEADHFRCRFYKVARTVCSDLMRGPRSRTKSLEGENWVDPRPGSATQVRRRDAKQTLWELVDTLPAPDAEALRLHHVEGWSLRRIARERGQRTFRIRRQMGASLEHLRPKLIAAGIADLL